MPNSSFFNLKESSFSIEEPSFMYKTHRVNQGVPACATMETRETRSKTPQNRIENALKTQNRMENAFKTHLDCRVRRCSCRQCHFSADWSSAIRKCHTFSGQISTYIKLQNSAFKLCTNVIWRRYIVETSSPWICNSRRERERQRERERERERPIKRRHVYTKQNLSSAGMYIQSSTFRVRPPPWCCKIQHFQYKIQHFHYKIEPFLVHYRPAAPRGLFNYYKIIVLLA